MAALNALFQASGLKVKSQNLDSFGRSPFALPLLAIIASLKGSLEENVLHEHKSACHKKAEKLALPCIPDFHTDEKGCCPSQPHSQLPSTAPAGDTCLPPTNIPLEGGAQEALSHQTD